MRKLGDRPRDGVVQTSVQDPEIAGADYDAQFFREFRDRLADIAVVVDDLGDRKAYKKQIATVLLCANPNVERVRRCLLQLLDNLSQK